MRAGQVKPFKGSCMQFPAREKCDQQQEPSACANGSVFLSLPAASSPPRDPTGISMSFLHPVLASLQPQGFCCTYRGVQGSRREQRGATSGAAQSQEPPCIKAQRRLQAELGQLWAPAQLSVMPSLARRTIRYEPGGCKLPLPLLEMQPALGREAAAVGQRPAMVWDGE